MLFFGGLLSARAATIGLNPSDKEHLDSREDELEGSQRRFQMQYPIQALRDSIFSIAGNNRAGSHASEFEIEPQECAVDSP